MFCCCLKVNYGVALHRTCYTIVCILPGAQPSTRLQPLQFSQLALPSLESPFALVNFWFLLLVTCGFQMWGSLEHLFLPQSASDLIFWSRDFLGFARSPRDFFGSWLLAPFDHPCHLKSRVPPPPPGIRSHMRRFIIRIYRRRTFFKSLVFCCMNDINKTI